MWRCCHPFGIGGRFDRNTHLSGAVRSDRAILRQGKQHILHHREPIVHAKILALDQQWSNIAGKAWMHHLGC